MAIFGSVVDQRWTVCVYQGKATRPRCRQRTIYGSRADAEQLEHAMRSAVPSRRGRTLPDRPFAFGALERAVAAPTVGILAEIIGTYRRHVYVLRQRGLTEPEADVYATRAGVHPSVVWPDWFAATQLCASSGFGDAPAR